MNDEDLMNIVNEVFEEIEVDDIIEEMDGEDHPLSDEDHPLSDDSDCISDCSDSFTKINKKIVDNSQIIALNRHMKQCAIYFYYSTGGALAVCASCMISLAELHIGQMYAIRKHVTECHDAIDGSFCSSCRNPLFLILPCNMCPICTQ